MIVSDWLVAGAAASIHDALGYLHREGICPCNMRRATANSAIKLFPDCHYWFCYDKRFSMQLHDIAKQARSSGTKLVTIDRPNKEYLREHKFDHFDIFVDVDDAPEQPTRERYGKPAYSGQLATEFACKNGATKIYLIGMDGYHSKDDYFDLGSLERPQFENCPERPFEMVRDVIQPRMQALADLYSEIEFVQIGRPVYSVDSPNWTVIRLTEPSLQSSVQNDL